jgi:hypothetical protein
MPRIDANGNLVRDDEPSSSNLLLTSLSAGSNVNVFGFNLSQRQLCILIAMLFLFVGVKGSE